MAIAKRISAIFSHLLVQMKLLVFIEAKDIITEIQSNTATMLATSSMIELEVAELKCREVMTMRQNPSKLAAVGRMCWEVLLDIFLKFKNTLR